MNNNPIIDDAIPLVKVFWTGGFDSSFRMVQLSGYNVAIQPYYLVDSKYRKSISYELNAISEITNDIEKNPATKCIINPLIKVDVSDVIPNREISEAYKRIRKQIPIGTQYEWLAGFALTNPGIEICLEKEEGGHIYNYLNTKGVMKSITDRDISYLILDGYDTDKDLFTIFGNFHFPMPLREWTKLDLVGEYKKLGFEETMNKTWFCHNPVNNEPCGVCNPCKIVVKEGLSFRMPPASMKRHATEMKYRNKSWFRLWKKVRWRLIGY